jgi:hypothetical protein
VKFLLLASLFGEQRDPHDLNRAARADGNRLRNAAYQDTAEGFSLGMLVAAHLSAQTRGASTLQYAHFCILATSPCGYGLHSQLRQSGTIDRKQDPHVCHPYSFSARESHKWSRNPLSYFVRNFNRGDSHSFRETRDSRCFSAAYMETRRKFR